eukprot:1162131-Pelagomonas_calceolata.AAC.6
MVPSNHQHPHACACTPAGRLKDARALCRACGQPWRAASIGGPGGDFGPLPVGLAAGQVEEELTEEMQVRTCASVCVCERTVMTMDGEGWWKLKCLRPGVSW